MVLFFVVLATAFPIDELQALSRWFSFVGGAACLSFVLTFVAMCESLLVPSLAPSWLYRCPTLQLVSTYVLCFAQFVSSAFSRTGQLPCSIAPAVFLSLHAARLGLFLWPRFRSSSGWCSCGRCCQAWGLPRSHTLVQWHLLCSLPQRWSFIVCILFVSLFYACPSLKKSRGVVLYGHMKCRGSWVPLEFLLALSRTLSLSSGLLSRQPVPGVSCDRHSVAWPCLHRFRIPKTPCSPRVCLVVSKSWLVQYPVLLPDVSSALPDFDTHWQLPYSSGGIGSGIKPHWWVSVLCLWSLYFYSFIIAHPTIWVNDWNRAN